MARFTGENINHYGSSGSGNKIPFFQLKNDKDVARVRFLYNGAEDIDGLSIHRVKVGDYERDVNCLREYTDPIDVCPFCREGIPCNAKLYIPLYNEDTQEIQFWTRGKSFFSQMSGWCARYPNTVGVVTDVERNGVAKDTKTTYQFYFVSQDDTTIDDILDDVELDDIPNPLGTTVLDKSAEEMEIYLQTGSFDSGEQVPSRRNRTVEAKSEEAPTDTGRVSRRTSRGRGDRF